MPAESNVITALAKIQSDIGGIRKTRGGEGGITYPYRGIDAIASEAQPLFGREGIVIVPTQAEITEIKEIMVNSRPWSDTFVSVLWTVYGPGGLSDSFIATTQGVGRDQSDKGISKAMTQAYKNLLLRILCIGDPQDDADQPQHQNNYTDARPAPVDPERQAAIDVFESIRALGADDKAAFSAWINEIDDHPKVTVDAMQADREWRLVVAEMVDTISTAFVADDPNDPLEPVQTGLAGVS